MAQIGIIKSKAVREVKSSVIKLKWNEKNGVIRFSVTSDGTTGEQWIARLESKGFRVDDYAKSVLRSKSFKPTTGITYEIAVLKGEIFSNSDRITKNIRIEANNRKFSTPNAEVACLIREKFSDKELEAMGLCWIAVMHEPIENYDGYPSLLYVFSGDGGSWLSADYDDPDFEWFRDYGSAFFVSQVYSA